MSNHLAIATVTKALVQLLQTAVGAAVSSARVVTRRPDATTTDTIVDVFLYQVTPNPALRNSDLPTRNARGDVVTRPASALDLHYLFSFYGDGDSYAAQRMLGAAVTALAAEPGLKRERIVSVSQDDNNDNMGASNLADAIEQVKFTQQALSLEEMSRIWSIFYQVPYVLSIAYKATVVILESEEPALASKPVLTRGQGDRGVETEVGPFPQLEGWHIGEGDADDNSRLQIRSYPAARLDTVLTLRGKNLGGGNASVRLVPKRFEDRKLDIPATAIDGRPGESKIAVSAATAGATKWIAGFYSAAIAITSGNETRATKSLDLPFAPRIDAIAVAPRDGDGNVTVTVTVAPDVDRRQLAVLVLPDREVVADPRQQDTNTLKFNVPKPAATGKPVDVYLRVDGADSLAFTGDGGKPPRPKLDSKSITFPA